MYALHHTLEHIQHNKVINVLIGPKLIICTYVCMYVIINWWR